MSLSNPSRIPGDLLPGLQSLRALAALAVVVFHAGRYVPAHLPEPAWRWGEFGVDVFFVVSGFVMMVATRPGATWREFVPRRAIRILPMYWLATLLMAALVLAAPRLFIAAVVTPAHFALSLALWPHYSPAMPGEVVPLLVPGWTLAYELYFYLVFAVCLRLVPAVRAVAVTGVLLAGFWLAPLAGDATSVAWIEFVANPIVLEFAFGMGVALAWQGGWRLPPRLAWPLVVLAAAAIVAFATPASRVWVAGLAGAAMVWAMASAPLARTAIGRALEVLGDASYSLYLLHPFVVGAAWFAWARTGAGGSAGAIGFIALCLAVSAIAGWIAWRVIEAPITRKLRSVIPAEAGIQ